MLDVTATERAEAELNKFIDAQASRRKGADPANITAAEERARTERKTAAEREQNRRDWVRYYRRLAFSNLQAARRYRAIVRDLENA